MLVLACYLVCDRLAFVICHRVASEHLGTSFCLPHDHSNIGITDVGYRAPLKRGVLGVNTQGPTLA